MPLAQLDQSPLAAGQQPAHTPRVIRVGFWQPSSSPFRPSLPTRLSSPACANTEPIYSRDSVRHAMATLQTGGPRPVRRYSAPFRAPRRIMRSLSFDYPALPLFSLTRPPFSARHYFVTVVEESRGASPHRSAVYGAELDLCPLSAPLRPLVGFVGGTLPAMDDAVRRQKMIQDRIADGRLPNNKIGRVSATYGLAKLATRAPWRCRPSRSSTGSGDWACRSSYSTTRASPSGRWSGIECIPHRLSLRRDARGGAFTALCDRF